MTTDERTQPALPAQIVLYQMATAHYLPHALRVVATLGIADRLKDGPRHASELAAATQTHAAALKRVLRLVANAGVLDEQEDGAFSLTPLGQCLRTDIPGSANAMVRLFAGARTLDNWKELEYCVRTGEPAIRKKGIADGLADPNRDPGDAAIFDAAMADLTRTLVVAVAAAYDFSPFRTLVDVGGGNGALLVGLLNANPGLRGVVFDLPSAAGRATQRIAESQLGDRCQVASGDFFKEVPRGGDAYILKHVIHDWDDERALTILRNCHRAMGPEARLLIVEGIYPRRIDQSPASRGAAANDVNMLVSTGGRQRSEAEFRSLYAAAGFTLTRIVPTQSRVSVIEGAPA
jgi:hypothetical protein